MFKTIRLPAFVLILTLTISMACEDDDVTTTFSGKVTRESDKKNAIGVRIVITGYEVEDSILWPASTEVSRDVVVVDSQGRFTLSLPENSSVDKYSMHAEDPSGGGVLVPFLSGCEWPCSSFRPGSKNEFVLEVQL